jgi:ribA/ribD-fused uncharacterized protein
MEVIDKFEGDFAFLSNFYPAEIIYKGICYPTVEHAYQAAKSDDPSVRRLMAHHSNPALAKKAGKVIRLREDWEDAKLGIMKELVAQKFQNPELRAMLDLTAGYELVEGNWWGDTYWGVCRGEGLNYLGNILMQIRDIKGNDNENS